MKKTPPLYLLLLVLALPLRAEIVIEQNAITGEADYGTGAGQSFLLPVGETVAAIQLHIASVANGGGSLRVRLWRATGSPGSYFTRLDSQPITSGILDRADVAGVPDWFTITLDDSFTNDEGEPVYLVFEIELLTSGGGGWNNYSYSNSNSYSGGHSVYWSEWRGNQYVIRDGEDWTFRILNNSNNVISRNIQLFVDFEFLPEHEYYSGRCLLWIEDSDPDSFYYLYSSSNLILPKSEWNQNGAWTGNGGRLYMNRYFVDIPDTIFYYVEESKTRK